MGDLLPVFALLAFSSVELIVGPTKGRAFFQPFMVGNKHCLLAILRIDVRLVIVHRSVIHMHDVLAACGALCTSVHYAIGYGVVAPSRRQESLRMSVASPGARGTFMVAWRTVGRARSRPHTHTVHLVIGIWHVVSDMRKRSGRVHNSYINSISATWWLLYLGHDRPQIGTVPSRYFLLRELRTSVMLIFEWLLE